MNLLNKLFPKKNEIPDTKNKNMILVEAYWNDTADKALVTELDNLLQDCSTRAEEFVRIAELCLPATTNEQLYYASKAYV